LTRHRYRSVWWNWYSRFQVGAAAAAAAAVEGRGVGVEVGGTQLLRGGAASALLPGRRALGKDRETRVVQASSSTADLSEE